MPETSKQPSQKEMDIIILRLKTVSSELHFSSGNDSQSFSRDEMIEEIKNNTEVGREFVATEFEFLRAVKDGSLREVLLDTAD